MIQLDSDQTLDIDRKKLTEIDSIILQSFMSEPSKQIFDYKSDNAAHHLNVVSLKGKQHILVNNKLGNADFLELDSTDQVALTLKLDQISSSLEIASHVLIGAQSRLYLLDKETGSVQSSVKLTRNIFTICQLSTYNFLVGQQGGQLAVVELAQDM